MKTRSLRPERRAPSATRGKREDDEADKVSGVFDPWSDSLLLLLHFRVKNVAGRSFDRFVAVKTGSLRRPSETGPAGRASLPLGHLQFQDDAGLAKWLVRYMLPQYLAEHLEELETDSYYRRHTADRWYQRAKAELEQLQAVLKVDQRASAVDDGRVVDGSSADERADHLLP